MADDPETQQFLARYGVACKRFDLVRPVLDDCYDFSMPERRRSTSVDEAEARTDRVFDSTAIDGLQGYASQMFDDIWPKDQKPVELVAGKDVPVAEREGVNRALAEVTEDIIETINNSNFGSAAPEAFQDHGIGTGVMMIDDGDALDPIRCRNLPLTAVRLDTGPYETIDALFEPREVKAGDLPVLYPKALENADLEKLARENPQTPVKVVEGVQRDWTARGTETWRYRCIAEKEKFVLKAGAYEGHGSCPFIAFSYTRVAGEVLGRGPVRMALPDIKTLNLVKQLILENADFAIGGMWMAEDDGVLNPNTITLAPGTIIPKAQGSRGLEPVESPARFDVAQMVLEDLQRAIKLMLGGDDLGPPTGTPMSAQEVMQRTVNRAKRIAGPYGRLLTEFLFPVVRRVAHIRRTQGAIRLPAIDGRLVQIRPLAPLTRAQAQDDILRHQRYLELVGQTFGPQTLGLMVNQEAYAEWLAGKIGFTPTLVRTRIERKQLAAAIAQAAQAAAAQGIDPTKLAG